MIVVKWLPEPRQYYYIHTYILYIGPVVPGAPPLLEVASSLQDFSASSIKTFGR